MVDLNQPSAGPAQTGTSVTSETAAQQSSGSSPEAGQENGQAPADRSDRASPERAVASTTSNDVILAAFSPDIVSALTNLVNRQVGPHEDGPKYSRIGAHILLSWDDRGSWILDRTDRFAISAEAWSSRSFTIDIKAPELPTITGQDFFLPVEAFPLYDVREVIASDENGNRLSTLSSVDQRYAIGSMLVALASSIVTADQTMLAEESETAKALRSAAFSRDLGQIDKIQNEAHRTALQNHSRFMNLARFFVAREFLCLRIAPAGIDKWPHAVRVTYQQAVESKPKLSGSWLRQAGAKLGIDATRLNITLPPARTASHWRYVITAPMGAELYGCRLIGGGTSSRQPATLTEGKQTVVQFGPEDGYTSLDIEFRISKQWRTWVLMNALLITLLLAVGAWRISFVIQNKTDLGTKDLTAAFLLGINGAFAGILARPTDDALTSTYLSGIRFAISILGILAFAAVATLAFGPSGDALFLVWLAFASMAGFIFILVFVGSGFLDRWRS